MDKLFKETKNDKKPNANKLIETVWSMENQKVSISDLGNEAENLIDLEPGVVDTQILSHPSDPKAARTNNK